jgi:hypothetical protein
MKICDGLRYANSCTHASITIATICAQAGEKPAYRPGIHDRSNFLGAGRAAQMTHGVYVFKIATTFIFDQSSFSNCIKANTF